MTPGRKTFAGFKKQLNRNVAGLKRSRLPNPIQNSASESKLRWIFPHLLSTGRSRLQQLIFSGKPGQKANLVESWRESENGCLADDDNGHLFGGHRTREKDLALNTGMRKGDVLHLKRESVHLREASSNSLNRKFGGAPGPTRTGGLRIRSPTLYPTELRVHIMQS
jgi:hypothetical protein